MDEVEALARGVGIADSGSALKFLKERRRIAERFEKFLHGWPPRTRIASKHGVFAEVLVFENLKLAETDEALARLEELLATHIGEVVDRCTPMEVAAVKGDGKPNAASSLRMDGQDVLKKFEEARRTQRNLNHHHATVKATCQAWLAGQWLLANVRSLRGAFNAEPAAFKFRSTVPLAETKVSQMSTKPQPQCSLPASSLSLLSDWAEYSDIPRPPSPPPAVRQKQGEESVVRSLFRWLFG